MSERNCPICECEKKNYIKSIKLSIPKEYRLHNNYNIVSCNECGFCYADTKSSKEDFEYYYKNFNTYALNYSDNLTIENNNEALKKVMKRYINKNHKIINIGIGNGQFEKRLFSLGYSNIMGIDPSSESVKILTDCGIKAKVGSVYDDVSEELQGRFDAVFLKYTLEHLIDPKGALLQLTKYLKEDGIMVISVPDIGMVHNNTTKILNNFNLEHINYFSRISLKNLFFKVGFGESSTYTITNTYNNQEEYMIMSVFKRDKQKKERYIKDEITEKSIKTYLTFEENSVSKEIIEELIKEKEEIIVWGIGAYTMSLLANDNLGKCNIISYIDNNPLKQNTMFNNRKVTLPSKEILEGKTVLVCSVLYANDIKEQILKMNINCKIIIL